MKECRGNYETFLVESISKVEWKEILLSWKEFFES